MAFIYIAKFSYGKPSIMRAVQVKETDKTIYVETGSDAVVYGSWEYVPNRLDLTTHKYKVCRTLHEALTYIQECAANNIVGLKRQTLLAQVHLMQITKSVNSSTDLED